MSAQSDRAARDLNDGPNPGAEHVGGPIPRYRVGRRNGHTIYLQLGSEADDNDRFIGSCVTPEAANALVFLANGGRM